MKSIKGKGFYIGPILLVLIALFAAGVIIFQKRADRDSLANRIINLGSGTASPATIDELRETIAQYEKKIEAHVQDAAQTGMYWKILATRLSDEGLHGEALEALDKAIAYFPEDPALHYLTGLAAATLAKSTYETSSRGGEAERMRLYAVAEAAQLRAIGLDDNYASPRYALGVLYVFELDRPEDAIPHLERFLELQAQDVDGMFILARAHYMLGEYSQAVDLYDRIIKTTRDDAKRSEAENNKTIVLDLLYG